LAEAKRVFQDNKRIRTRLRRSGSCHFLCLDGKRRRDSSAPMGNTNKPLVLTENAGSEILRRTPGRPKKPGGVKPNFSNCAPTCACCAMRTKYNPQYTGGGDQASGRPAARRRRFPLGPLARL
jgi:hypothetical protein